MNVSDVDEIFFLGGMNDGMLYMCRYYQCGSEVITTSACWIMQWDHSSVGSNLRLKNG